MFRTTGNSDLVARSTPATGLRAPVRRAGQSSASKLLAFRLVLLVGALLAACGQGSSPSPNEKETVAAVASKVGSACTSQVTTSVADRPIQANPWTSSVGSKVTFTTTLSGCTDPEFRVYHALPGQGYALWKDWGQVGSTFVWDTTGEPPGQHAVSVWARAKGSTAQPEIAYGMYYVLLPSPSCTGLTATTSPIAGGLAENPNMAAIGTPVTFTASPVGCSQPDYRILYSPPSGGWFVESEWNSSPSYVWQTTGKEVGNYWFRIYARSHDSAAEYEWMLPFSYKLLPSPL